MDKHHISVADEGSIGCERSLLIFAVQSIDIEVILSKKARSGTQPEAQASGAASG